MPTQVKPINLSAGPLEDTAAESEKEPDPSKWKTFATNTTLHGLRNVVATRRSIFHRAIWFIFLCGSFVYYSFLVASSIQRYWSLPIQTIISQETPADGLDFPAVTICNLNKLMKSKIEVADDDKRFKEMGLNISGCSETRAVRGNFTCGQSLLCASSPYGSLLVQGCNNATRQKFIKAFKSTLVNDEELLTKYGHDMLGLTSQFHYCRFQKRILCSHKDFVPTVTADGICYTFNSGFNNSKLLRSKFAGPGLGLSILLDVQTNETTVSELSNGLTVIIHDPNMVANRLHGFNIIPGTHALLSVKSIKHIRLPAPYRTNCRQTKLPGIGSYSRDACIAQCFSNVTLEYCGCRDPGISGPKTARLCSTVNDGACIENSHGKVNWTACNCSNACSEREYESHISYSRFPGSDVIVKILQNSVGVKESSSYMKENYVFLQVGFKHLAVETREDVPSYGSESLFGEIGGNMGLFLGCSILTICEFFDFLWEALMSRISKRSTEQMRPQ